MKNAKSWSLAVSILLIGMIILFIIGFFLMSIDAHAETNYYSAEQYTENDRLLHGQRPHHAGKPPELRPAGVWRRKRPLHLAENA